MECRVSGGIEGGIGVGGVIGQAGGAGALGVGRG